MFQPLKYSLESNGFVVILYYIVHIPLIYHLQRISRQSSHLSAMNMILPHCVHQKLQSQQNFTATLGSNEAIRN